MNRYIVGVTGASGSLYAKKLVDELLKGGNEVHLTATENGLKVFEYELKTSLCADIFTDISSRAGKLVFHDVHDLFASISSGSFRTEGMAVIPCSMSTLGEIAACSSKNLLGRAADVCIKEKRKLVLVPREAPLSTIHIKNMLALSEAGAVILPAAPGFYHHPQSIEDLVNFVVGKVLDALGVENSLYEKWR